MADLARVQRELSDLPGLIEVGLGTPSNLVEMTVFHDVSSVLRPAV